MSVNGETHYTNLFPSLWQTGWRPRFLCSLYPCTLVMWLCSFFQSKGESISLLLWIWAGPVTWFGQQNKVYVTQFLRWGLKRLYLLYLSSWSAVLRQHATWSSILDENVEKSHGTKASASTNCQNYEWCRLRPSSAAELPAECCSPVIPGKASKGFSHP